MKINKIKNSFLSLLLIATIFSCEKEPIENVVEKTSASDLNVKSKNGVLVFKDYQQMEIVRNKLANLSEDEIQIWEAQNDFQSLLSLEKKINYAEVKHQESFFKGVNPNLSVKEYEAMGYFYKHTDLYNTYLKKGVIEEKIQNDGSISTELSVKDHYLLNILSEEGKVIVADELIVVKNKDTYVYDTKSNKLLRSTNSTNQKLNNEFNFDKGTGTVGNRFISDPAKGSNYRYYAYVKFSSSFTVSSLSQRLYWEARAEQKKFGNWNTRNDYNPIWGCSAYWSYDYWIIYPNTGFGVVRNGSQYPLPNSSNKPTSPYYVSNMHTNYTGPRELQFSDIYSINPTTVGYSFFDNVRVYNYSFEFKFSGGSSGYNYTYN